MIAFPTEFPMDALKVLGQFMIQKNVPLVDAATAGWNLIGFGGNKALAGTDQTMWGEMAPTEEQKIQFFTSLEMSKGIFDKIPAWVFEMAMDLVLTYLKRKVS